jgi:hypothetical protein
MMLYDKQKNLLLNDQTLESAGVKPPCTLHLYLHSYPTYFTAFKNRSVEALNCMKVLHHKIPSILFDIGCVVIGEWFVITKNVDCVAWTCCCRRYRRRRRRRCWFGLLFVVW